MLYNVAQSNKKNILPGVIQEVTLYFVNRQSKISSLVILGALWPEVVVCRVIQIVITEIMSSLKGHIGNFFVLSYIRHKDFSSFHLCLCPSGSDHRALHQDLSKYLTTQDNHFRPTPSKHNRAMCSHGSLLSLQSWSTIQVNKTFVVPSIDQIHPKSKYSSELGTNNV